ncbi:Na(+)/H(+) antiporter subunit C [Shouchella clausii]|uniref:Na(+)/H(+) antiporter subunit C n=1 Tax=Shouchella clausii TaxID=79880 RepID=A0A268S5B5_SHOCL|nr:Na(+)/H(+) antiporter subunit C [Shouchella clausii]PAD43646.1 Na(+)/H(+) antiporter subunit C [Bacillus sp. 7520-S]AST98137.1 Na(+)/H(+) antiporter subunit C [Shouchella clausii]MBU8595316.1 Na(+)/H(+) antiporter subunit C [Shouchella clausii]MCR1286933.1 Na(+)/H(+) antiporter subunit C [Shouchella clausii]MCY1103374.1 Na(+)/H(+) antiporter subunit C [Shouchella clausii]
MEILMFIVIGVFFAIGTYLLLARSLLRVIVSLMILSHGAHLLLLTMAGLNAEAPPLEHMADGGYTDPLPQALILTAIVISFGITAFLVVLGYRTYKVHNTDDLEKLRGSADE